MILLTQGRLSFGLAYSSPDLFVALLCFTAGAVTFDEIEKARGEKKKVPLSEIWEMGQ